MPPSGAVQTWAPWWRCRSARGQADGPLDVGGGRRLQAFAQRLQLAVHGQALQRQPAHERRRNVQLQAGQRRGLAGVQLLQQQRQIGRAQRPLQGGGQRHQVGGIAVGKQQAHARPVGHHAVHAQGPTQRMHGVCAGWRARSRPRGRATAARSAARAGGAGAAAAGGPAARPPCRREGAAVARPAGPRNGPAPPPEAARADRQEARRQRVGGAWPGRVQQAAMLRPASGAPAAGPLCWPA